MIVQESCASFHASVIMKQTEPDQTYGQLVVRSTCLALIYMTVQFSMCDIVLYSITNASTVSMPTSGNVTATDGTRNNIGRPVSIFQGKTQQRNARLWT